MYFYIQIIIKVLFALLLLGCSGPYSELEKEFKAKHEIKGEHIDSRTIVLTGQNYRSSYKLTEIVDVFLSPSFVELNVNSLGYDKIQIPVSSISGCSKTCFGEGRWDADLLLGSQGVKISIVNSDKVLHWCWENNLPVITGENRRAWLSKKASLPELSEYKQVNQTEYSEQLKRSCNGY